jgi:hypothetical protein
MALDARKAILVTGDLSIDPSDCTLQESPILHEFSVFRCLEDFSEAPSLAIAIVMWP